MNPFWNDKRVVVTGANGFLGARLVDALKEHGCRDASLAPGGGAAPSPNALMQGTPNTIFHVSQPVGGAVLESGTLADLQARNRARTLQLVEAAHSAGVKRFFAIGHCDALSGESNGMEQACFVLPHVYGPGAEIDRHSTCPVHRLIAELMEAKLHDREDVALQGSPDERLQLLHADDAAQALVRLAAEPRHGERRRLIGGDARTMEQLARKVAELLKYTGRIEWQHSGRPAAAPHLENAETVEQRVRLEDGLQQTLHDYRQRALATPNQWQRPAELHAHNNYMEDVNAPAGRAPNAQPGDPAGVLYRKERRKSQ